MNRTKERWNSILWIEGMAFSILIALSWLTEAIHIPHLIFSEPFVPDWNRAILRSVVILLLWGWVHCATRQLLRRLYYLEDFLRICGWCRKICLNGEWMPMEQYFKSQFATRMTHGMCPDCLKQGVKQLEALEQGQSPGEKTEKSSSARPTGLS